MTHVNVEVCSVVLLWYLYDLCSSVSSGTSASSRAGSSTCQGQTQRPCQAMHKTTSTRMPRDINAPCLSYTRRCSVQAQNHPAHSACQGRQAAEPHRESRRRHRRTSPRVAGGNGDTWNSYEALTAQMQSIELQIPEQGVAFLWRHVSVALWSWQWHRTHKHTRARAYAAELSDFQALVSGLTWFFDLLSKVDPFERRC